MSTAAAALALTGNNVYGCVACISTYVCVCLLATSWGACPFCKCVSPLWGVLPVHALGRFGGRYDGSMFQALQVHRGQ